MRAMYLFLEEEVDLYIDSPPFKKKNGFFAILCWKQSIMRSIEIYLPI